MAGTIVVDRIESDASYASTINVAGQITFSNTVNFGATAQRITGDFSNATVASRVMFQTSTVNSATRVEAIPNGTATTCNLAAYNNSDPTNASAARLTATSSESRVESTITGTGTYLPLSFYTGGSERMRIDSSGNVGIGTSSPSFKLQVVGASNSIATQILPQGALPDNTDNAGLYVLHQGTAGTGFRVRTDNALTGTQFAHILVNNASASINGFQVSQYGTGWIADFNKSGTTALRIDSSGNLLFNSGYGSAATAYGCRAWANFTSSATTPTLNASGNVTSVTRASTGTYTVNLTNAMPDANYSAVGTASSTIYARIIQTSALATGSFVVRLVAETAALVDGTFPICVAVFR